MIQNYQKQEKPQKLTTFMRCLIFVVLACISISCNHRNRCQTPQIRLAESLIWSYPDSARLILEDLDTFSLSETDLMYWHLIHEHASLRIDPTRTHNNVLLMVIDYFRKHKNRRYEGEAHYVYGTECYYSYNYQDAILHLKSAENLIPYMDSLQPYAGLIYIIEGYIAETEELYHIANEYYQQALQAIKPTGDTRRIAFCYRDIARTAVAEQDSIKRTYYNKAKENALLAGDSLLYRDIELQCMSNILPIDSEAVLSRSLYMVDSIGHTLYAGFIAEYYVRLNNMDSSSLYLEVLAQDTVKQEWIRNRYHYIHSLYLAKQGKEKESFEELQQVYTDQCQQITNDAKSRTFAIARRYDYEREHEKTLLLTIKQQRLWLIFGFAVSCLTIILVWLWYRVRLNRAKLREEEQRRLLSETRVKNLRIEIQERRKYLRQLFLARVLLTRDLIKAESNTQFKLPSWFEEKLRSFTFANKNQWSIFQKEFREVYGDLQDNLLEKYPNLSHEDIQYLLLRILGLDNNDIAYLLQLSPQTIWNRRQKVKKRMDVASLTIWQEQFMKKYDTMMIHPERYRRDKQNH